MFFKTEIFFGVIIKKNNFILTLLSISYPELKSRTRFHPSANFSDSNDKTVLPKYESLTSLASILLVTGNNCCFHSYLEYMGHEEQSTRLLLLQTAETGNMHGNAKHSPSLGVPLVLWNPCVALWLPRSAWWHFKSTINGECAVILLGKESRVLRPLSGQAGWYLRPARRVMEGTRKNVEHWIVVVV